MTRQTRFLARLFGLFMVVVSIWLLLERDEMRGAVEALVRDRAATLLLSFLCLGAGTATVVGHQVWSGGAAPVLVTLLGWILLVRGVLLLFLPADVLQAVADAVLIPVWFHLVGAIALCVGLYLTYAGFRAPPILFREK